MLSVNSVYAFLSNVNLLLQKLQSAPNRNSSWRRYEANARLCRRSKQNSLRTAEPESMGIQTASSAQPNSKECACRDPRILVSSVVDRRESRRRYRVPGTHMPAHFGRSAMSDQGAGPSFPTSPHSEAGGWPILSNLTSLRGCPVLVSAHSAETGRGI